MRKTNQKSVVRVHYPLFRNVKAALKSAGLYAYMCVMALSISLSVVIALTACSFLSRAQTDRTDVTHKYFTSVLVKPGDTLTSIAGRYADGHYDSVDDYIREVRMTNHLQEDEIHAGSYLIVPYYSHEVR